MKKSVKFGLGLAAMIILLIMSVIYEEWNGVMGIAIGVLIIIVGGFIGKLLYSGFRSFIEVYAKWIPNAITLSNLCLGMLAILWVSQEPKSIVPAIFILVAALLDTCDGKLARRWDAVSAIGKELDSLSDLVTFGIAPMVLLWQSTFSEFKVIGAIFVCFYAASGAFRLARYNVTANCTSFMGMPITCAGILTTLWYMSPYKELYIATAIWTLFLAVAMVSKVKFKRIDDFKMVKNMKCVAERRKCKRIAKKSA